MVNWIAIVVISLFLIFGNYSFLDLKEAIVYYGESISQHYPDIGSYLFVLVVLFLIFSNEIIAYFKKIKIRIKQNF